MNALEEAGYCARVYEDAVYEYAQDEEQYYFENFDHDRVKESLLSELDDYRVTIDAVMVDDFGSVGAEGEADMSSLLHADAENLLESLADVVEAEPRFVTFSAISEPFRGATRHVVGVKVFCSSTFEECCYLPREEWGTAKEAVLKALWVNKLEPALEEAMFRMASTITAALEREEAFVKSDLEDIRDEDRAAEFLLERAEDGDIPFPCAHCRDTDCPKHEDYEEDTDGDS